MSNTATNNNKYYDIDDTWVSATSVYNYMMNDPLLDWLHYHNNSLNSISETNKNDKKKILKTLSNKIISSNESVGSSLNFTPYIMNQVRIFERKVMKMINKKF